MPSLELPSKRVLVEEDTLKIHGYPAKVVVYAEVYKRWFRTDYKGRHVRVDVYLPWEGERVKREMIHDRRYGDDRSLLFGSPLPSRRDHKHETIQEAKDTVAELDAVKTDEAEAGRVSLSR